MAIALRAAQASKTSAAGTTITMTVPTGVVDGDVMVMQVTSRSTATVPTVPGGWTSLTSVTGTSTTPSGILCWRVASSEPASYAVTTASVESAGAIIALSGANTTAPTSSQYGQQGNASSSTVTSPALGSWSSANGIDIFLGGLQSASSTPAAPTNYTEPTNHTAQSGGTGTTAICSDVAYRVLSSVTTIGSITALWSTTGANIGGHVFIFEATAVAPTVTTTAISDTGPIEVTAGGNVTADGGATVTERGLVWATTANPTTANTKVIDGATGTGAYTDNITGLSTSSTYHYRAYAINSVGTSYGADIQFTTLGLMLNNYQFIKVGDGMSVSEKIR